MAGFPTELFLTLVGGHRCCSRRPRSTARWSGSPSLAVRCCRGNVGLMPIMFFGLALALASIGAGNIAAAALVGPMAMAVRRPGGHPGLPDDDHGRPRRRGRRPVAVRADGDHRRRPDEPDGAVRARVADLLRTTCWPTPVVAFAGYFAVRRLAAVPPSARRRGSADAAARRRGRRGRSDGPARGHPGRDRRADRRGGRLRGPRGDGGVRGGGPAVAAAAWPTSRRRSVRCPGA